MSSWLMRTWCVAVAASAGTFAYTAAHGGGDPGMPVPNVRYTPGALNPAVTQATLKTTVCVPGYSTSIRPPVSYTEKLKRQQIVLYGYEDKKPSDYEEDHDISLSLGGSPIDLGNLWPEPHPSSFAKDKLEFFLYKGICGGAKQRDGTIVKLTLAQAQADIRGDWTKAYRRYIAP